MRFREFLHIHMKTGQLNDFSEYKQIIMHNKKMHKSLNQLHNSEQPMLSIVNYVRNFTKIHDGVTVLIREKHSYHAS